jgi:hypothetical protein
MRPQRRRIIPVFLLVRPRGTQEPFEQREFHSYATSPHHAEQLARAYAEKSYEVGQSH